MKTRVTLNELILVVSALSIANLSAAALKQNVSPDAGLLAAPHSASNTLEEGITTGNFEDLYPGLYPGYGWAREVREIGSNGLFQAEYLVFDETQAANSRHTIRGTPLTILLFRPNSKPGDATVGFAPPWSQPAFHSPLSGRRRGPDSSAQSALLAVGEALLGIQYSVTNSAHYLFLSDSESLTFTAQLPAHFTGVGTDGAPELHRVYIGLRPGVRGQTDLVIEHTPLFIHLAGGQTTFQHVIAENVRLFHLHYLQPAAGEVLDSWPYTNQIPRLIQITLELGRSHRSRSSSTELASRIFSIPAVGLAPVYQGSSPRGTNAPPFPPPRFNNAQLQDWADNAGQSQPIAHILFPGVPASSGIRSSNRIDADQTVELEWLVRSGVELAKYVLALESSGPFALVDSLKQRWAGGPGAQNSVAAQIPLEDLRLGSGRISLKFIDLDRRLNLNVADEMSLRQALTLIGAEPSRFQPIIDSILDWRDRDDLSRSEGAENNYYRRLNPAYVARNGPFDDISELLWVKSMTPEIYYGGVTGAGVEIVGIEDLFTAASRGPINVNTASKDVLQMIPDFDQYIAGAIIHARAGPDGQDGTADDTPFRSPAEIGIRVPGLGNPAAVQFFTRYFTVRSSVFEVTVDVECGGEKRQYVAWLARENPKLIQILKMRQN